jgi:FKBP-type peptidyl-prolyl cis-trans isomerase FklB
MPGFNGAAEKPVQTPGTQKQKESYSLGYQFGLGVKGDKIEIDLETLLQGLRDAVSGQESPMNREEMKKALADLRQRVRDEQRRKMQEEMVRNAEESDRFLRENGKKEGVRVTKSGLQYVVLKEGNGAAPGMDESVKVNYRGTFADGREFDSSFARGTPQTVRTDGVIKGWTEALQMMKAGSKWRIFVPPDLAYGRTGLGQKIPPNTVLVFEIELVSIEKNEKGGVKDLSEQTKGEKGGGN